MNTKKGDGLYREDQACQGFSCGAAPLGCANKQYCPLNEDPREIFDDFPQDDYEDYDEEELEREFREGE